MCKIYLFRIAAAPIYLDWNYLFDNLCDTKSTKFFLQ